MISAPEEFWFDEKAAKRAVEFFPDCLIHVKGPLAGEPFVLEPWQIKIVREVFGWKRKDGTRKHRIVYIEIPRKNGKSTFAAGIALYVLLEDMGGEVYSCAHTRDQASLVFGMAASMVRKSSWLNRKFKVRDSLKRIIYQDKDSFYRAIPADAHAAHGANPSGIIFDELHTQPNAELWEVMQTGTGAREQPLTVALTTAGYDRQSICWQVHQHALAVLSGERKDPAFYPVLFAADPGDDWTNEDVWEKANPCLDVSLRRDYLRGECQRAQDNPSYENTFRRLHLNQWTEQAVRHMPMEHWDACNGDVPDFTGADCYAGLDIASTRDLTSLVLVFPHEGQFYVKPFFWAPKEAATKRDRQDRQSYRGWEKTYIDLTEGNSIDQSVIRAKMFDLASQHNIIHTGFDDWNMTECYQQLLRDGWPEDKISKFGQNHANYNEPMKKALELVRDRKLHHGGHPVLRWNAANVVAKEDHNGNIKPDKEKSQDKIDGYCAFLMGLGLALEGQRVRQGSVLVF